MDPETVHRKPSPPFPSAPLPSSILHLPRLAGPLHVPPPRACSHTCPRSTFPPPPKARLQQEIGGGDVVDEITGNYWLGRSWKLLELLIPPASFFCSPAVSPHLVPLLPCLTFPQSTPPTSPSWHRRPVLSRLVQSLAFHFHSHSHTLIHTNLTCLALGPIFFLHCLNALSSIQKFPASK
ncbi:hypothetical protein LY76DRAFT_29492 [Colletotrichum caudatum]|nr:hypothetical protein LY76DRAFT_29492 [Colletotrichum caudatum]